MERHYTLAFLTTFLMGLAIGVYVYFAGYAPVATEVVEVTQEFTESLEVVGEAYGACTSSGLCPSFQVADDGDYRYFYRPAGSDELILREGSLSRAMQADLRRSVSVNELQVASRPTNPVFCNSYENGIDVRYRVTVGETDYNLDSCGTDVNPDGALWVSLSNIWNYFETI